VSHQQLRIPDEIARLIRSLHPTIKRKVRAALQAIIETPACGKPLKEELAGLRSYRIGRFRIVYRIAEDRLIEIVAIGPRRYIYAETYRKVRGENQ
jgi:mRNA interferase RelE/StbE